MRVLKTRSVHARKESRIYLPRRFGINHHPGFGLSLLVFQQLGRHGIIWMDLNGEEIVAIEQLDQ